MPRYAPTMPQADLRRMLIDRAVRNDYLEQYGAIDAASPDMTRIVHMLLMEELLPDVEKDWSKINFSTENMDVTAEKMTAGGVPYLLVSAGGDWETPLSCVIYFDGRKLRGYVPKDGNSYNHSTKAAFGNNDDDAAACARQFGERFDHEEGYRDVDPDAARVERDVSARIEAKGTHSHVTGAVVSKATDKAARQRVIEAKQDLSGPITADMVYAVISLAAGASYVQFELRSSRRELTVDEGERLVGVPARLEKTVPGYSNGKEILWYAPMECYPAQTQALLEAAGFVQAPDNDISAYQGARTVVIR
jgi:hypothetical protein